MSSIAELDQFRHDYRNGLPLAEHQKLYEWIAANFPDQNHADHGFVSLFLDWCRPSTIVELGGWDGTLANAMGYRAFTRWDNYEVAPIPQVCTDPRYHFHLDDQWVWENPIRAGAFIASHSLEHLTEEHLDALLAALHCDHAYVDVPLGDSSTTWAGDHSTHVLRLSISEFDDRWVGAGWRIVQRYDALAGVPSKVRFLERL